MTTQTNITTFAASNKSSQSTSVAGRTSGSKSRGTRVQDGSISISGARNFSGASISVCKQEVLEDVVDRGLKVTGLSRKLGISDKGTSVKSLIAELFENDERKEQVMEALQTKQGRKERVALESVTNAEVMILQEGLVIKPKMVEVLPKLEMEAQEEECAKKTMKKLKNVFIDAFQNSREWKERNFKTRDLMRSLLLQYLDVCEKLLDSSCASSACETEVDEDEIDLTATCCCGSAKHIIYKELGEEVKLLLACKDFVGNEHRGHDSLLPVTMPLRQILASGQDFMALNTRKSLAAIVGRKIEQQLPVTESLFPSCSKWSEASQTITLLVEGIDAREITAIAFRGLRKIGIKMARKDAEETQSPIASHTRKQQRLK